MLFATKFIFKVYHLAVVMFKEDIKTFSLVYQRRKKVIEKSCYNLKKITVQLVLMI